MTAPDALEVRGLEVSVQGRAGSRGDPVPILRGVSLSVARGGSLGVVGSSGSGKTTLALALLGLLPAGATVRGSVRIAGREVIGLDDRRLSAIRGRTASIVLQDPAAALNPVLAISRQVEEAVLAHQPLGRAELRDRVGTLLERAGLPPPVQRLGALPSELSGGMRQRVAIAIAMAHDPDLLIADEPTTDLDTVVQAQVLDALDAARRRAGSALVLVTHDLAVVAQRVEQVVVLDGGAVVESGPVGEVLARPRSGPARALVASRLPARGPGARPAPASGGPVLAAIGLVQRFPLGRTGRSTVPGHAVHAVNGVSLDLYAGRALGLVGESGSGKSSVCRMLVGLDRPAAGTVQFRGRPVAGMGRAELRAMRSEVQVVFQDPSRALDPSMSVSAIIAEPLRIHRRGADPWKPVAEALELVGLDQRVGTRRPHALSAGERQRVAIARAMVLRPAVLVLDEPVSSLDASTRAGVLRLLVALQDQLGLAYLLVSHDLAVVGAVAHEIAVMHAGRIVEHGPTPEILGAPRHPYTEALVAAMPAGGDDQRRAAAALVGDPPDPRQPAPGCRFRTRCPLIPVLAPADAQRCATDVPELAHAAAGHPVACHFR